MNQFHRKTFLKVYFYGGGATFRDQSKAYFWQQKVQSLFIVFESLTLIV